MARRLPERPGLERFKIVRGAVKDIPRSVATMFSGQPAWATLAFAASVVLLLGVLSVVSHFAPGALAYVGLLGGLALGVSLLVFVNLPGWVHLGAEGLFIDQRDDQRYIALSDIDGADTFTERMMGKNMVGVDIALRSKSSVRVIVGENQFGAPERATALSLRIRDALEAHRARESAEDASQLEQGNRTTQEWVDRLRGLGEGANATLRAAPIPRDRLWRIALDPTAEPALRAGAAVALTPSLDEDEKERLRVAAASTAAPKLRLALESAASGDEEGLAAAVADVERRAR